MPQSKTCLVVAHLKSNRSGTVDFYAFDQDFISFDRKWRDDESNFASPIKIKDPSLIALPLTHHSHYHLLQSHVHFRGRVYIARCLNPICRKCAKSDDDCTLVDSWNLSDNRWTSLPRMNHPQLKSHLHVFDGELYALGCPKGIDDPHSYEWDFDLKCVTFSKRKNYPLFIERLDETKGRWTMLPRPPPHLKLDGLSFVSAVVEELGCILFGSMACKYFYAYMPTHDEPWKRMDHLPFRNVILNYSQLLTVVGCHLLWLTGCGSTLVAFDAKHGVYSMIDLVDEGLLPSRKRFYRFPVLVHVGDGELALIFIHNSMYKLKGKGGKIESFSSIRCMRFYINFRRAGTGKRCCELVSRQKFIGPEFCGHLVAAFTADLVLPRRSLKRKRLEEA